MKKSIKYFIAVAFTLGFLSCDDFLDRPPLSDMSPTTFFASRGDMKTWTAGIYDEFQSALSLGHLEWGDIRSDNYHTTGYDDGKAYMNAIESTQSQYSWESLYSTIDRCNVAIERFPNIEGMVEADWADYVGQARGMRALMYFYAIRVWGDVPLVTKPWDGGLDTYSVDRAPVADVKVQIMNDIDKAIEYLNSNVTSDRKYYFNLSAAWALKMDTHMWFHEYQQALDCYTNYFAKSSAYSLVTNAADWKKMFLVPAESSETIFNMNWFYDVDGSHPWAQRVGASNTNNPYKISEGIFTEFVNRLHSGNGSDGRFPNVVDTVKLWNSGNKVPISTSHWSVSGIEKCVKYSDVDPTATTSYWTILSSSNADIDICIYRYADVLLLYAEALNQLGQPAEALKIVNNIRKRVGYLADAITEVDLSDKKAVETVILNERQLEFIAEGKRWFDLCRTGRVVEVMDPVLRARQQAAGGTVTGFGDEGRILFPIYYREFESNLKLRGHQNPPYTEG
jgi:tetratricopeptide (TPR) repeat protein